MADDRVTIERIKQVTRDLRLDLTKLDLAAYLTMVGLHVGMDAKMGCVTILPERNQAIEIDAFLRPYGFVTPKEDIGGTATEVFAQLIRQRLTIGTLETDHE